MVTTVTSKVTTVTPKVTTVTPKVTTVTSNDTSAAVSGVGKLVLETLTRLQIVGSSVAQRVLPATLPRSSSVVLGRAGNETAAPRIAADLAWLEQAASGSENSDPHHKRDVATRALEAVFAQYGR